MQAYLSDTIKSVLASTYPNFEVILMDDGSKDNSRSIAIDYVARDTRLKFYSQPNSGASRARNQAIEKASGTYILPVDADNLISEDYIEQAVDVLENHPNVKIVTCNSIFFGDKQGPVNLPPFSLKLLARKNLMDNCAMYRKSDWEIAGGYCPEIMGREDWDFWISLLKTGGDVYKLPLVGLHYRVTPNSKRKRTRHLKGVIIEQMNQRHKAFFYKHLGGKLRKSRTWSRLINFLSNIIQPENIYCSENFKNLDEFVYSCTETYTKYGPGNKFKIEDCELTITEFKDDSFFSKGKAKKAFQKSINSVGYYEKCTFLWHKKSYLVSLTNNVTDFPVEKLKASLIIAIYNNISFLKVVLDSLSHQTENDFEIIITEDGNNQEVADYIRNYPFLHKWQHLTQEDEGWRKNRALNNAIKSANTEWLIFIDGDCVLHPRFIEMHLRYADNKSVLAGKRVKLDNSSSQKMLSDISKIEKIQCSLIRKLFFGKGKIKFLEEGIFISPDGLLKFIPANRKLNRLKGCNMSFSKKSIYAINGFDEDFILPAVGEDEDLSWRFRAAGFEHKSVRNLAVQYHLHHTENWVDQEINRTISQSKEANNEFFCRNGLNK